MSRIALNHGLYTNLLCLQQISCGLNSTQNILSTGKKINSAIDNSSSYYTARSLNHRAADLNVLLDNMGQKIQTIKAASEGINTATSYLEQMTSVAEQAIEKTQTHKNNDNLIAEGYTLITSDMTAGEISSLINSGAKVALASDINIDDTITITASNVEFNGNNYTINFSGSGSALTSTKAAIEVTGTNTSAEFKNMVINASGDWAVGISSRNGANVTIDNTYGIKMTGNNSYRVSHRDELLYAGKYNTSSIIAEIGPDGLAAKACDDFYVVSTDENWYLPSFGELLDVYGYDKSQIPAGKSNNDKVVGAIGDNKTAINAALKTLKNKGVAANELTDSWYWSSSEDSSNNSWNLGMNTGYRGNKSKYNNGYVRSFQLLEDIYDPMKSNLAAPQVGDIMYADKTWGAADDYDGSKTAVGVITNVSDDQRDVTIMSLKDVGSSLKWLTTDANINNIKNYNYSRASTSFKSEGTIMVANIASTATGEELVSSNADSLEYNRMYAQYDNVIKDSSYKGVNLLKGDCMEVSFNEGGTNKLTVEGQDISTSAIGLNKAAWYTIDDVAKSINEIKAAINTLRFVASDLGNNNSIIQTRQDFTEKLINTLEEGADKLTLADMNEASADMLMLQTRQALAISALSLATYADRNVLSLF